MGWFRAIFSRLLSLDTDNLLTSGRNAFPALSESEYDFPEYCELGQDIRAKSTHLCWTRISLVSANRNQRSLVRTSRSAGATVWKKYSSSGLRMLSNWSLSNSDPENPGTRVVDSATQTLDSGQVAWPSPCKKFDGDGWLENSLRSSVSAGCALWQKVIPQFWIRIYVMRVCWVWSEHTGMRPGRLEARGNYWTTVKAHALHFLHTKKVRQTHCLDDLRCWWSTWWIWRDVAELILDLYDARLLGVIWAYRHASRASGSKGELSNHGHSISICDDSSSDIGAAWWILPWPGSLYTFPIYMIKSHIIHIFPI